MKKNLLSMSQLTNFGKYVVFGLKDINIYDKLKVVGSPIMEGWHMDSIYVMSIGLAYIDKTWKNETIDLWCARWACGI